MKGLSAKELGLISTLEFEKKYFFTTADIDAFVKNKTQVTAEGTVYRTISLSVETGKRKDNDAQEYVSG